MRALVEQKGLLQISDPGALVAIVDSVLAGKSYILVTFGRMWSSPECSTPSRCHHDVGSIRSLEPPKQCGAWLSNQSGMPGFVENPAQLEQYRGGKTKLQGYFVG